MMAHEADGGQQAAEQCGDKGCADGEEDELHVHAKRMQHGQG